MRERFNRQLDRLARTHVRIGHARCGSFRLCGVAGLACALGLGSWLAVYAGLSLWVLAAVALSSVLAFLGLALVTKIVAGVERLVYYHQQTGVLVSAAYVLWVSGRPVLPYMDLVAVGVGAFLCCGRVGCLMVGCCYGRPHRWGVRYDEGHAAEGFPACYVGARLLPVQAFEALWTLAVVAACCLTVVVRRPAGSALSLYVVAYAVGRFCLEFARGDAERPYLRGFSEAQWTSLMLTSAVVAAEWSGLLPRDGWHLAAALGLAASMLLVAARRRRDGAWRHRLLHPRHVRELAETMRTLTRREGEPRADEEGAPVVAPVPVRCTSLGVLISASEGGAGHYALSCRDGRMDEETARSLADLICRLRGRPAADAHLLVRRAIFHLIFPADSFTA
jgi:hypothetical protein